MQTHPVLGVDVDDVQLMLTELVSNAIRHGSGPVDAELVAQGSTLRLNVSDSCDVMPQQSPAAGNESGGRGLTLIGKVATRWAATPRPEGGKTVWCEFGSPSRATTPADPQASHVVVAAIDQRIGAPAHAIPPHVSSESLRRALCGALVGGWVIFRHLPFTASANAACQRCAQLATPGVANP